VRIDVVRIDPEDARVQAAEEAEQRLFEYYGLTYRVHYVELEEPAIRVRVLETGSGPPLLMLPGGNGIGAELVPLMAALPGYRRFAVNLPGGGLSDAVDVRDVDYRALAVQVLDSVLEALGIERSPVVANSIGGLWALWLAQSRPQRVERMVLVGCPALIFGTAAPLPMRLLSSRLFNRFLFPLAQPGSPGAMRKVLGKLLGSTPAAVQALPDALPDALHRMFHLPTYRLATLSFLETVLTLRGSNERFQLHADELGRIEQPVLFIWGDNDPFGGVDVGRKAVRAMPDARLQVIAAGHVPYLDDPEGCARLIQGFLP
jgi:pimeloyl-ACP methyl ester carboxylesterase